MICHDFGTKDIVNDALTNVFFDQWYMLVSSGVENEIWLERFKNLPDSSRISDVCDPRQVFDVRRFLVQFAFNVVDPVFTATQQNDRSRLEAGELSAKFRTD